MSQVGSTVSVNGTPGDDVVVCAGGDVQTIIVNGVAYRFDAGTISEIVVDGNSGRDSLTTKSDNMATLRATEVESVTDLDARALAAQAGPRPEILEELLLRLVWLQREMDAR